MKSVLIIAFSFVLTLPLCFAQNYEWPLINVSSKDITGTFCEYRSGHLHVSQWGTVLDILTNSILKLVQGDNGGDCTYI